MLAGLFQITVGVILLAFGGGAGVPPEPGVVAPEPDVVPPEPVVVLPEPVVVPPESVVVPPEPVVVPPEPVVVPPEPVVVPPEPVVAAGVTVSVSVALLLPALGSIVPDGVCTDTVLVTLPEVAVTVTVTTIS